MTASTVIERLISAFREHPDRLALSAANGKVSYAELGRRVAGIVRSVREHEPPHVPARIGVLTGDEVETYAAIIAILFCGSAYVPLNRKNPVERNAAIVDAAGLDLILLPDAADAAAECLPAGPALLSTSGLSDSTPPQDAVGATDGLAYIFFTSGTTGSPKGVPISWRNLDAFIRAFVDDPAYGFTPDDRFLQMFELTFDLSVVSWLAPLVIGASCHVVPDRGIASLNVARTLAEGEVTVALMVPSVLSYLRRYFDELSFPAIRHSLFCGEALLHELTEEWSACTPNAVIRNVYGPTEATIFCTEFVWESAQSARQSINGVVPIGSAIGETVLVIVDQDDRPAARGQQGELCLIGPQLTTGYWRDPERTAEAFLEVDVEGRRARAYRTGDLARLNDEGSFLYCGRADFQIQVDGHRVELAEVEFHAREFVAGEDVAAVPTRTDDGRQEFVLFVRMGADEEQTRDYLRRKLPEYMVPREVVAVDEFPLNLNGKVDRKQLAERYLDVATK